MITISNTDPFDDDSFAECPCGDGYQTVVDTVASTLGRPLTDRDVRVDYPNMYVYFEGGAYLWVVRYTEYGRDEKPCHHSDWILTRYYPDRTEVSHHPTSDGLKEPVAAFAKDLGTHPVNSSIGDFLGLPESSSDPYWVHTICPRSYKDARRIGEAYRAGCPVIINMTETNDHDSHRIVDFAAGLVFAMHGSIERVTRGVFLLSPANVDVRDAPAVRSARGDNA